MCTETAPASFINSFYNYDFVSIMCSDEFSTDDDDDDDDDDDSLVAI